MHFVLSRASLHYFDYCVWMTAFPLFVVQFLLSHPSSTIMSISVTSSVLLSSPHLFLSPSSLYDLHAYVSLSDTHLI